MRCVAKWQQLISYLKEKKVPESTLLTCSEMTYSEKTIMGLVQRDAFPTEISTLSKSGRVLNASRLKTLRPYLEENLIKVGGRLPPTTLPEEAQHPIVLLNYSEAIKLLNKWTHDRNGHCGQNHLLALLCEKYWILQVHSKLWTMIYNCF